MYTYGIFHEFTRVLSFLSDILQKELGFDMKILNIGGGFNGSEFQLKQVLQACQSNFSL